MKLKKKRIRLSMLSFIWCKNRALCGGIHVCMFTGEPKFKTEYAPKIIARLGGDSSMATQERYTWLPISESLLGGLSLLK